LFSQGLKVFLFPNRLEKNLCSFFWQLFYELFTTVNFLTWLSLVNMKGLKSLLLHFSLILNLDHFGIPTDPCYTDTNNHRSCYVDKSLETFSNGVQTCQGLGGHLPNVFTIGETKFLRENFLGEMWMGLTTDVTWVVTTFVLINACLKWRLFHSNSCLLRRLF